MRVNHEDGAGRRCGFTLVPMKFAVSDPALRHAGDMRAMLEAAATALRSRAEEASRPSHDEIARLTAAFTSTCLAREQRIGESIRVDPGHPWQIGLFDRRTQRAIEAMRAATDETAGDISRRLDIVGLSAVLWQRPAQLLLVLVR